MLGLVGILMIVIMLLWLEQRAARAAHFERYGTHHPVHITIDADGTETMVIDTTKTGPSVSVTRVLPPQGPPPPDAQ